MHQSIFLVIAASISSIITTAVSGIRKWPGAGVGV